LVEKELPHLTGPLAHYGRLYAALFPLTVILTLLPPYRATREAYFATVWEMAATAGGDPARVAVVLLLVLFGCLLAALVRPSVLPLPVSIGCTSWVFGVLLWTRPATGDPPPPLSLYGKAQLVLVAGLVAVTAAHSVQLIIHRRRVERAERVAGPGRVPAGPVNI
jgi:hypothetical protein